MKEKENGEKQNVACFKNICDFNVISQNKRDKLEYKQQPVNPLE